MEKGKTKFRVISEYDYEGVLPIPDWVLADLKKPKENSSMWGGGHYQHNNTKIEIDKESVNG